MEIATLLRRKRRLRTLGIDDGPFVRGSNRSVLVVGAVYSASQFEGLLTTHVRQDGLNATAKLIQMIQPSKFRAQLHLILLDGITLGGFNVVDLPLLADRVGIPAVAVMRKSPNHAAVGQALSHLPGWERRLEVMRRAGPIHQAGCLCFQVAGLEPAIAAEAILSCVLHGNLPECLRAAHLIASGVVTGTSIGRA